SRPRQACSQSVKHTLSCWLFGVGKAMRRTDQPPAARSTASTWATLTTCCRVVRQDSAWAQVTWWMRSASDGPGCCMLPPPYLAGTLSAYGTGVHEDKGSAEDFPTARQVTRRCDSGSPAGRQAHSDRSDRLLLTSRQSISGLPLITIVLHSSPGRIALLTA